MGEKALEFLGVSRVSTEGTGNYFAVLENFPPASVSRTRSGRHEDVDLMRQNLRRQYPEANENAIDCPLRLWLLQCRERQRSGRAHRENC